jgi:hypothetical protein
MSRAKYFCQILTKFEILWQIVVLVLIIKCNKSPPVGAALIHVADRRADGTFHAARSPDPD